MSDPPQQVPEPSQSESQDAAPADEGSLAPADSSSSGSTTGANPLRRSATSQAWVSVAVFAVILVLLVVFFAQNTDQVSVRFLGWTWHAPLAVVALSGVVAGLILAVIAGTLRIVQLRRRVRRTA